MEHYGISLKMMQLLSYFIVEKGYTQVAIHQRPGDVWLVQARNRRYPILHLSEESDETLSRQLPQLRQVNRALCDLVHRESKVVVLNVREGSHSFENAYMQQVAFSDHVEETFARSFPSASKQLVHVEDEQAEMARLAREMEEARRFQSFWRERLSLLPRYALMICGFVLLCSLLLWTVPSAWMARIWFGEAGNALLSQFTMRSIPMLIQLPALFSVALLADGLYHRGTLFIALCSIVFGALFQIISPMAQAGSIASLAAGLWSAGLLDVWASRAYRHPFIRRQLLRQLFWMITALLVTQAWVSVLGGVLGGLLAAMCCGRGSFHQEMRPHAYAAFAVLIALVSIWMALFGQQWQLERDYARTIQYETMAQS